MKLTIIRTFYKLIGRLGISKSKYGIKNGYKDRKTVTHFLDMEFSDEWQDEVYSLAKLFFDNNSFKSIIDVGTGSGYKLIKYFSDSDTIGMEIEPGLTTLKNKYPNRKWLNPLESDFSVLESDIVITSDVIEHVPDPIAFLKNLKKIKNVKYYFISTPERKNLYNSLDFGPPTNTHHYREWQYDEFHNFVSEEFEIVYHFLTNIPQSTQLIVCKIKSSIQIS